MWSSDKFRIKAFANFVDTVAVMPNCALKAVRKADSDRKLACRTASTFNMRDFRKALSGIKAQFLEKLRGG